MSNNGNMAEGRYLRCKSCGTRWDDGEVINTSRPGCCRNPNIHIMNYLHRWKNSWPGNFCLDCGLEDPREDDGFLENCWYCLAVPEVAETCRACGGTGCLPRQGVVIPPCPGSP